MAFRLFNKVGRGFAARRIALYGEGSDPNNIVVAPLHLRPISTAPSAPAEGDIYWDTDLNTILCYSGSAWVNCASGGGSATFDDVTTTDDVIVGDDLNVTGLATIGETLAVTGASTLSGAVNFKRQVTDTGGAFATPIALTEAQSGRVILLDDAAGLDFTLPAIAAAQIGTHYKFLVTVSVTSNSYRVTAQAGDLLKGGLLCVDFDAAVTAPQAIFLEPDGTDDLIMTLNGTTSGGGKVGSWVEFIAISATEWFVHGVVAGDGTIVTPFS